jgi:hypothetical protein
MLCNRSKLKNIAGNQKKIKSFERFFHQTQAVKAFQQNEFLQTFFNIIFFYFATSFFSKNNGKNFFTAQKNLFPP